MDVQILAVTSLIGILITVMIYISKIFNNGKELKNAQEEDVQKAVEKTRKKSESVSFYILHNGSLSFYNVLGDLEAFNIFLMIFSTFGHTLHKKVFMQKLDSSSFLYRDFSISQ